MATQVGGVTIGFGVNLTQIMSGIKKVEGRLGKFQEKMKNIRLTGAVTGDPFSATKNYFKESEKVLNKTLQSWGKEIKYVQEKMNKFAVSSRKNAAEVIKSYDKISKKWKTLTSAKTLKRGEGGILKGAIWPSVDPKAGKEDIGGPDLSKVKKRLLRDFKGYSKELDTVVNSLVAKINKGTINSKKEFEKHFGLMKAIIAKDGKKVVTDYKKFGKVLEKSFKLQERLKYAGDISLAKDTKRIHADRLKALKELKVAEVGLRKEINLGLNVSKNRAKLADTMNKRVALGVKLTRKQSLELKQLNEAQEKLKASTGFLSKAWFKQRAGWFIQLRAFWGIYRAAADAFETVKKFEEELKNLQSVTRSTGAELDSMKDVTKEVGATMAVELTSVASGMVKLGQAGLSVEETSGAIKEVATLAVATMADMATASDLVTTAMRAWGEETDDITHVVDVLANTVNMSKVTIDKLSTALQYVTGVAPQVGLSFQETAGIIGTLANQGIKLSKVGTGLRSLLGELLRPSKKFKDELHKVGLTLKDIDVEARGFTNVLESLKQSGFDATSAFKGLDRRAASAIAALIGQGDKLRGFVDSLGEVGVASEMAATQMESLNKKIVITTNKLAILASKIFDVYKPILKLGTDAVGGLAESLSNLNPALATFARFFTTGVIATGLTLLTHMIYGYIVAIYKYIAGVTEATAVTGFFATSIKGLQAALIALKGPLGIIAVAVTALILFGEYIAKSKYELSKLAKEAKKARKEYIDLNSEYEEFVDLTKKYKEALDEGNDAQADRLSQMDKELERLHSLTFSRKEAMELIKEEADAKRKAAEEALKTARRKEAYEAGARAKKALQVMKTPDVAGIPLGSPYSPERGEERQARIEREGYAAAKHARITMKSQARAFIEENKKAGTSVDEVVAKLKEWYVEYDAIKKLSREVDLPPFEEWIKAAITEQKKLTKEATEWQKIMERVKTGEYKKGDLTKVYDVLLEKNEELAEVFEKYPKYGKAFKKLFEEEPTKAIKMVRKLSTGLSETTETTMTKVKQILEDSNIFKALKEDGDDFLGIIDELTKALVDEQLLKKLGGVLEISADKKVEAKISALREEVKQIGKERIGVEKEVAKWKERTTKLLKGQVLTEKQINEIESMRDQAIKKTRDEYSKTIQERIDDIKNEINELKNLNEFESERIEIIGDYNEKARETRKQIAVIEGVNRKLTESEKENVELLRQYLKLLGIVKEMKTDDVNREEKINAIRSKAEEDILALEQKRTSLEINDPTNKKQLADLELAISDRKIEQYKAVMDIEDRAKEQLDLAEKINDEELNRLKILEKQKRAYSIMYDFVGRMKDKLVSFHDMMAQAAEDFATGIATGTGSIMTNVTGGFQKQRQKIAELEDELKNLNKEYQKAMSEGNIERAREIKNEMAGLKDNIEDLEDPIKNIGDAFRSMFKDLIDSIRKAINEWIAMKVVMGIVEWAGAGTDFGGRGAWDVSTKDYVSLSKAKGGVLPSIKSFKSFSDGGLTGRPTMALLGDNQSGKEIVIPEENIQSNQVSGYTRDKESGRELTIINALTKQDIAEAIAGKEGKNVIVNHIGKDLKTRGPISRVIKQN